MKRTLILRFLARDAAFISKLSLVVLLMAAAAWAQQAPCESCRYGMVRVTSGQTVQINLAAPVARSCSMQAGFYGPDANWLDAPISVSLEPGQTHTVQHKHVSGVRFEEIAPVVSSVTVSPGEHPPSPCITDVEIIDDLIGFTRVLIAPGPPEIPLGPNAAQLRLPPVGLAWGQGIRLNVVAPLLQSQTCSAFLSFSDSHGIQVGSGKLVTLAPGHAETLELNSFGLLSSPGSRISLQPVVDLEVAPAPAVCIPTVEVFDNRSLTDWILVSPASWAPAPASLPAFGNLRTKE